MKQIFDKLENIEKLLNVALVNGSSNPENSSDGEKSFLTDLPLGSVSAVNDFDKIISTSAEKFNSLVCILIKLLLHFYELKQ